MYTYPSIHLSDSNITADEMNAQWKSLTSAGFDVINKDSADIIERQITNIYLFGIVLFMLAVFLLQKTVLKLFIIIKEFFLGRAKRSQVAPLDKVKTHNINTYDIEIDNISRNTLATYRINSNP